MRRINRRAKQSIIHVIAGITAVCVSTPLAGMVGKNADVISKGVVEFAGGVGEYVGESISVNSPLVLEVNGSSLDLPIEVMPDDVLPVASGEESTEVLEDLVDIDDTDFPIIQDDTLKNMLQNQDTDEKEVSVISFNVAGFTEDLSVYTNHDGEIVRSTFKPNAGENFINLETAGQVRNTTDLPNAQVRENIYTLPNIEMTMSGEPEVLIMHTHTSESFQLPNSDYYDDTYPARSTDSSQNIVAVGKKIAEEIARYGIGVIHDGTIHDYPEYNGAYSRSAVAVEELLKMYPSIKIVLDIHRDAIVDGSSPVAAVTAIDGKNAAQVMIISAADDGTYDLPNYMENLKLAAHLQQQMESDHPGITRPVLFQYCHYNQDLSTGSLLIEVGSHGNTIDEAVYTGELIGKSIGKALVELCESE